MGREVRRVPADWNHPQQGRGGFIPLYGGSASEEIRSWDEGAAQWERGFRRDHLHGGWTEISRRHQGRTFEEYSGPRPDPKEYMPDWPENARTHYQMYETITEGTPISPVMSSPEELARWLADNGANAFGGETATYDEWLRVCRGGIAPSAVGTEQGLVSGVAGLESKTKE